MRIFVTTSKRNPGRGERDPWGAEEGAFIREVHTSGNADSELSDTVEVVTQFMRKRGYNEFIVTLQGEAGS